MSDPAGWHPQTAEGLAGGVRAPDSRLTERLLARGTRPLGVIDVRRAEAHYARIVDWLAARTPLLEHLRARYGLTEGEGASALSLAFADAGTGEFAHAPGVGLSAGDVGLSLSAVPEAFTARAAETSVTYTAHVPEDSAAPAEAKRIARRGVPVFSRADSDSLRAVSDTSRAVSETQQPDGGARQEPDEAARQQQRGAVPAIPERAGPNLERAESNLELANSNVESAGQKAEPPRGGGAAPTVKEIPAKEIPAATAGADGARFADVRLVSASRAAATAPPESPRSPTPRGVAPSEARGATSTAAPGGTLARSEEPLRSAGELIGVRPKDGGGPVGTLAQGKPPRAGVSEVYEAQGDDTPAAEAQPRAVVRERARAAPAEAANERAASPVGEMARGAREAQAVSHEPRAVAHEARAVAREASAQSASAPAESPMPLARAREIPVNDSRPESPTLRTQSPLPLVQPLVQSPMPLAQPPMPAASSNGVGRGTAAVRPGHSATVTHAPTVETFTPGRGGARAGGVNVERLTEQVSSRLTQRLLAERERRGMGRR